MIYQKNSEHQYCLQKIPAVKLFLAPLYRSCKSSCVEIVIVSLIVLFDIRIKYMAFFEDKGQVVMMVFDRIRLCVVLFQIMAI